ncbi:hypothetical protein NPIL_384791 [Nephila pilipes]|uniref:Uncharacterized protein n=1 Tax=Nephila pilipes TaxID=299642 RepID=A0A8X6MP74_NEPPI|nr:hypothetical protein NPIL_384791 [Nephila pilipes]
MSEDKVTFHYKYGQTVPKITTATGLKFHIETYPILQERTPGQAHYLRIRKANRNNCSHKISLILSVPGATDIIERTLVFYRGTTSLNLNISVREIWKLSSNNVDVIHCELSTEKL